METDHGWRVNSFLCTNLDHNRNKEELKFAYLIMRMICYMLVRILRGIVEMQDCNGPKAFRPL